MAASGGEVADDPILGAVVAVASSAKVTVSRAGPVQLVVEVGREDYPALVEAARAGGFETFIDLCGVDHLAREPRFDVVVNLLSTQHTVGGGVLRAQVEDLQFIAPETGRLAVVVDDRHAALSSQPRVELTGKQLLGPLVGCGRHPIGFLGACDPEVVDPSSLLCPMRPPVRGLLLLRPLGVAAPGIVAHRVALNSTGTEPIR